MNQRSSGTVIPKRRRPGRPPKYPWEEWFRRVYRRELTLIRGRDFTSMPHTMMQMARAAAVRRGLGIGVGLGIDRIVIRLKEEPPCPA